MVKKRDKNVGGTARWHNLSTKKKLELKGLHPSIVIACTLPVVGGFVRNCVGFEEEQKESAVSVAGGSFGASIDNNNMDLNVSRRPFPQLSQRKSSSYSSSRDLSRTLDETQHSVNAPTHVRINSYLEKEKRRGKYEAYYALKSIHLNRVNDILFVKELMNEIEIMKRLDHAHISKLVETYEDEGHLYLIMELCSGGDLYSRDPYTEDQAARIMGSILSAVDFMHSHGIIHRDLKYENILFANQSPTAEIK
jgi:hypothetical protein